MPATPDVDSVDFKERSQSIADTRKYIKECGEGLTPTQKACMHNWVLKTLTGLVSMIPRMQRSFPEIAPELSTLQSQIFLVVDKGKRLNPRKDRHTTSYTHS